MWCCVDRRGWKDSLGIKANEQTRTIDSGIECVEAPIADNGIVHWHRHIRELLCNGLAKNDQAIKQCCCPKARYSVVVYVRAQRGECVKGPTANKQCNCQKVSKLNLDESWVWGGLTWGGQ
jgi:hypothetical protein